VAVLSDVGHHPRLAGQEASPGQATVQRQSQPEVRVEAASRVPVDELVAVEHLDHGALGLRQRPQYAVDHRLKSDIELPAGPRHGDLDREQGLVLDHRRALGREHGVALGDRTPELQLGHDLPGERPQ
jgi:hypothetical protein